MSVGVIAVGILVIFSCAAAYALKTLMEWIAQ